MMKKKYKNKMETENKSKEVVLDKFTFPKYNITIEASSLLEAQEKLEKRLKVGDADNK